jgi:spermidine/putrescine transport system permease protein
VSVAARTAAPARTRRRLALRRDPWGHPRGLALVTWVYILWSLAPVVLAIRFAFNEGRSRSAAQGWSLRWFWKDPTLSVFHDPTLRSALEQSLRLAALAMLIATPLGVGLALGLQRWRGRGSGTANRLTLLPLVTPELVFAVGLFLLFTTAFSFVGLGTTAQVIGHVTFSVSFVVVIVRGRLQTIGPELEEAAADLGAPPWEVVRRVLLPLLLPAIGASLLIVFALSIDDFVVSQYLASGADTTTVPMRIYAQARAAPTPALNALATLMLLATLLALALAYVIFRITTRGERAGGSAIGQLASLEATIDAGGTR